MAWPWFNPVRGQPFRIYSNLRIKNLFGPGQSWLLLAMEGCQLHNVVAVIMARDANL